MPQPEDVIKASSREILRNLDDVNHEVLHLFEDTAKVLIDQYDGDAEKALQIALAYTSGHYKHKLQQKSLLNGQEGYVTMKINVDRGYLNSRDVTGILRKYWEPRVADNARNMKNLIDGTGVVFDIKSEHLERFLDNFERLKETDNRIEFEVSRCKELPEMEEEGGYNQNWRDQGRNDLQRSARGGASGGFDRRGGSRGGGSSGWGRDDRSDFGRGNKRGGYDD